MVIGASFYTDVLRELIAALGAALFFGNLWALLKRRSDAHRAEELAAAKPSRAGPPDGKAAGSNVGEQPAGDDEPRPDLAQAPLARTVVYLVLGFVVMVAGIAAIVAG